MSNRKVHILQGQLVLNKETNRYDLYSNGECLVNGFHCGDGLEVQINGIWIPTAFELNNDWYLVGLKGITLDKLTARKCY